MTDFTKAREQVTNYLRRIEARMNSFGSALPGYRERPRHHLVLVSEQEYDFGWLFCYDAKERVDTGDTEHALAGNAPLIVDRADGQIYVTGTAHPLEHYIAEYRKGTRRRAEPTT